MAQLELFAEPDVTHSSIPTVESIRVRLDRVLTPLRSASEFPWTGKEAARWKLVVPQMAEWLPTEERDAVRAEFAALIQRFETQLV